jgi:hypothetical protein
VTELKAEEGREARRKGGMKRHRFGEREKGDMKGEKRKRIGGKGEKVIEKKAAPTG